MSPQPTTQTTAQQLLGIANRAGLMRVLEDRLLAMMTMPPDELYEAAIGMYCALLECQRYFHLRPGNWEIQLNEIVGRAIASAEGRPLDFGECGEDDASCDCSWHENMRAAIAQGGGVTR